MSAPASFLNPKLVAIKGRDGDEREYYLSHFPAIAGREIITQYPISAVPKLGEYKTNEALMLKIMGFVAARVVMPDGTERAIPLDSAALVNNHCGDFERLMRLEAAMIEYNVSFFQNGAASNFLTSIEARAGALITKTLTDFLRPSSTKDSPPSTS